MEPCRHASRWTLKSQIIFHYFSPKSSSYVILGFQMPVRKEHPLSNRKAQWLLFCVVVVVENSKIEIDHGFAAERRYGFPRKKKLDTGQTI
jgi:hypothetical protein